MLAAHAAGRTGDRIVLRLFRPAVSIGCHQTFVHEARRQYCDDAGVEVVRRPTAGGALYLDAGQQGMSLVVPAAALGANLAERLAAGAELVAEALARLGVPSEFKAPNDLQVAGRQKIASVFLAEAGGSALLLATMIARLDLKAAMQALLVPTEKLTVTGLEHARERMVSLAELLGRAPEAAVSAHALEAAAEGRLGRGCARGGARLGEPWPGPRKCHGRLVKTGSKPRTRWSARRCGCCGDGGGHGRRRCALPPTGT